MKKNLKQSFHAIVLIFLAAWFVATLLVIVQTRVSRFPEPPPDDRPVKCLRWEVLPCVLEIRKLAFDTHKAGEDRSFPENWTPCFENGLWTFLRAHLMRTRFTYLFLRTLRTGFLPTERARTFTFPYFIIVGNILCFRQKTAL